MIKPVEYKCVVKLHAVEEVSKGGIVLSTQGIKAREQQAQVKGELMAIGGNAFEDWKGDIPEVGQTVLIAKYSGLVYPDGDEEYRIINDKDVAAIIS